MLVTNIHNKLIRIATETGCLIISLFMVFPIENFRIKINRNPAKRASEGIETSIGAFGTNSVNKIENGVKNIEVKKTSFKSVKAYQTIKKINGIKTPK